MSDLTNDQIIEEFKRQVRLCSGIGLAKMLEIINAQFNKPRKHKWRFYMNGTFCEHCNAPAGSQLECKG